MVVRAEAIRFALEASNEGSGKKVHRKTTFTSIFKCSDFREMFDHCTRHVS